MALDPRRDFRRPFGVAVAVAVCLVSIWAVQSESRDIRPSEHGVAHEKNPGAASPAMLAFFGDRAAVALPEAQNVTDPVWAVSGRVSPTPSGGGERRRVALLAAGVVCGVVGVGLVGAAALAYARRSKAGFGAGCGLCLTRRRSGPEVRLGGA